jgi:hypothetical protein
MMKKMNKIPEKNPFRVPEGYFEELNRKLISVTLDKSPAKRRFLFSSRIRPFLLAAASVAGFILLSYAAIRVFIPDRFSHQVTEVVPDDYYLPYINDLDIYSLEENASSVTMPEQGPDVSKAEIIEYLILENIEISEIYEHL